LTPPKDDETQRMDSLLAKLSQSGVPKPAAEPEAPAAPGKHDALPVDQRAEQLAALAEHPPTRGEELADMGRLAASLARSAPERVTADLLARVAKTAPGARGFMEGVKHLPAGERAKLLGGLPIESRKQLFDELGTDGKDLAHTVALVASLLEADPDLAAEAIDWGGTTLAKALAEQIGDAGVKALPAPVRKAVTAQLTPPPAAEPA
jgi:hypothetical protein